MTILAIALSLIGFPALVLAVFWLEKPWQRASNIHERNGETISRTWIMVPLPFGHHVEIHKRPRPISRPPAFPPNQSTKTALRR